jgi:DNA-binding MarR family transcriptional regulator
MKIDKQAKPKMISLDPDSDEAFRFSEYPMFYIGHIQRQNFINLSAALKTFDLIPLEWRALAQLQEKDGVSVSELAEIVISERSALSRVIGTMESKGLVKRLPDKKDQRATQVLLTKKGLSVFKDILPIVRKKLAWTLDGLSTEEKDNMMQLLTKLYSNIRRSPFA